MSTAAPSLINVSVRITSIRSVNRKGCIAFGHRMDVALGINDRSSPVVIRVSDAIAKLSDIAVGAIFEVYGEATTVLRSHGTFVVSELTVEKSKPPVCGTLWGNVCTTPWITLTTGRLN